MKLQLKQQTQKIQMNRFKIPQRLKEIANVFLQNDYEVFLVGGAVRDYCLGKKPHDFDIATNAKPEKVQNIFERVVATGIKHGTVTILYKGLKVECTTFRTEGKYSDDRHPDDVKYVTSIDEDLSRRDFTINAMAISLKNYKLLDLFGGLFDLKSKIIKTVGIAEERFSEDALRMIRAIRFASQLNFELEPKTENAIITLAEKIYKVSNERIRDEFSKILLTFEPIVGLKLLEKTSLLEKIIPELVKGRGVDQGSYHKADVLEHSFLVCNNTPKTLELRLAGLLHDVSKPQTKITDKIGEIHFYGHDVLGEKTSRIILTRLKYPKKIIDKVCTLIRYHMFNYTSEWKDKTIRKFIAKVGVENIDELLQLRLADIKGLKKDCADIAHIVEFKTRIEKILKTEDCLSLKSLEVNGSDLIELKIKPGKTMGLILDELLQVVLDDPSENTKDRLLEIAKKLKEKYHV